MNLPNGFWEMLHLCVEVNPYSSHIMWWPWERSKNGYHIPLVYKRLPRILFHMLLPDLCGQQIIFNTTL